MEQPAAGSAERALCLERQGGAARRQQTQLAESTAGREHSWQEQLRASPEARGAEQPSALESFSSGPFWLLRADTEW